MTTPKADLPEIMASINKRLQWRDINDEAPPYLTLRREEVEALLDAPEVLDPQVDHDAIDSVRTHLEYCHKNGLHLISCQTHHVAKLLTAFDMTGRPTPGRSASSIFARARAPSGSGNMTITTSRCPHEQPHSLE